MSDLHPIASRLATAKNFALGMNPSKVGLQPDRAEFDPCVSTLRATNGPEQVQQTVWLASDLSAQSRDSEQECTKFLSSWHPSRCWNMRSRLKQQSPNQSPIALFKLLFFKCDKHTVALDGRQSRKH
jgi:hypothetical protein